MEAQMAASPQVLTQGARVGPQVLHLRQVPVRPLPWEGHCDSYWFKEPTSHLQPQQPSPYSHVDPTVPTQVMLRQI